MLDLTTDPAPFFEGEADAPPGGQVVWLACADGVRIRAAHWQPEGARGTVLVFPGRTEYLEKYGPVMGEFSGMGLASIIVDWRGQGLSERVHPDPLMGHVGAFADYQLDVAAMVAHAETLRLPRPWYLMTHSMGGAIGLRALIEGLEVVASAHSAPMWGMRMTPTLRPVAWTLAALAEPLGLSGRLAPTQQSTPYPMRVAFDDNVLTTDPAQYARVQDILTAHPELALGGPSLHWVGEALQEIRRLNAAPGPKIPSLALLGAEESIVDTVSITARVASWPDCELITYPGARHELLIERPETRDALFARLQDFFT